MEGTKEVTGFTNTMKAITWCKRLLGFSGVWPLEIRDSLFLPLLFYGFIYIFLGVLDLIDYINDFHYALTNIMENLLILMTLMKFGICRLKHGSLSRFLTETENDYNVDNYKTKEERLIFMKYNKFAYIFIIIAFPSITFVILSYYCKTVIPGIINVMRNSTSEYKLPYKIKPLLKPYDAKTYVFGCIHEFLRIIMVISANSGTDCLLASTGFHLTGQLAILNCRAKEILKETDVSQQGIHKIILRHHRLIRLADILEDSFNIVICQQLLGTTIQICISSYQILSVMKTSMAYLSVLRTLMETKL
ncbi:uncharacterized protein LOC124957351 isoform X2 [Vespa velutina]|uniref:uncharacterized protein LOC124957351 isoform X2 n=1 Tax=Vespa velutina TaxID=202808 RepID=UPI001FB28714|nr:uncharacterized protein LOC124957351 isoform X2 [Vespa velutina]